MDSVRKKWNRDQKRLRSILEEGDPQGEGFQLFFKQHAALHSCKMDGGDHWSLEDQILDDLPEMQCREIIQGHDHSIAWLIWHIARIEDVAISMLVGGEEQLYIRGNWDQKLGVVYPHTGNAMVANEIEELSRGIVIEGLREYRQAVGRHTREIVASLAWEQLSNKVEPARIRRIADQGAVLPEAQGVLDYWSRRTLAGLLLMPATRHNLIHLNEAERLKHRIQH
jgi:hypothetical protein